MTTPRAPFRVGFGYDVHAFKAGRRLVLGGVEIPHLRGLDGHSDADVLTHALADAILGALALPDIGIYFPNTDDAIEGIDSQRILAKARDEAARLGWSIGNLDCTLIAEEPKLAPHVGDMRARLAATLGIAPDAIGLKATTHEKIGDLGRARGIAAHAVCLLFRA